MKNALQTIQQIRDWFPQAPGEMSVNINSYGVTVCLHEVKDYALATEILRSVGIADRDKQIFESDGRHLVNLHGRTPEGIEIKVFCEQLPPTCRLEKTLERIPKQQTVDTGDFIEVERLKVVCGEPVEQAT